MSNQRRPEFDFDRDLVLPIQQELRRYKPKYTEILEKSGHKRIKRKKSSWVRRYWKKFVKTFK